MSTLDARQEVGEATAGAGFVAPADLDEDVKQWLDDFRAKHGRPPRLLHIGNIANNAYNNGKLLNQAGCDCNVLCYDYYHVMGCPEWQDADFEGEVAPILSRLDARRSEGLPAAEVVRARPPAILHPLPAGQARTPPRAVDRAVVATGWPEPHHAGNAIPGRLPCNKAAVEES